MTRTQLARVQRRPVALARRVVGTPAEVAATVALVRDSGRLLSMTAPEQLPGSDRVTVTVRFLDTPTAAPPVVRRLRRGHVIAAAATVPGIAAVAGVGYAAVQITNAVRAAAPLIAGVVLVLVVLAVLLRSRTSSCVGLHCSGCRH
ncbi:hypothetical protein [Verrucosispora sp. WMMD1129]|uniref:hypothetical protein n=1 Tax=Verrucosispora sp. WMMD1129 TaxID=3016093 RepID=UPI00249C7E8B|nr:hypothetical protein [Verrucosispora sp. WMMD1129]WFE45694.1 hypothetical protein O7624_15705 [Verrucosispora sp. WMMD1129]